MDRDGFAIKKLADSKQVETGTVTLHWDGSDDTHVVADEAYTFKIDWSSKEKKETYFPANKPRESIFLKATYYDRQRRLLLYGLTLPSRMHIHASSGKINANGEFEGAVLKTLVDREPRAAGAVQEAWDGMDENGTIYVPDLPDFGISIAAEPLPENTVLTIGNKTRNFLSWVAQRKGQSFYGAQKKESGHHGLSVLEDISPKLKVNPEDAEWSNEIEVGW
ncbi:hypothetical protein L0152_01980 [bacterium]|nr:hypothetical protein [bacterium]